MKRVLRLGFASLILLNLAVRLHQQPRSEADTMAGLRAGLDKIAIRTERTSEPSVLAGWSASCARPLYAMSAPIDGSQDEVVHDVGAADAPHRYIYLGSVLAARDRAAMIGRWAWATLLFNFGERAHRPSFNLALVVLPGDCPDLASLPWDALSPWD